MTRANVAEAGEVRAPSWSFLALSALVAWNLSSILEAFIAGRAPLPPLDPGEKAGIAYAIGFSRLELMVSGATAGLILTAPVFVWSGRRLLHRRAASAALQRNVARTFGSAAALLGAALLFAVDYELSWLLT